MSEQPDLPSSFDPATYRRASPRDQQREETRRLGVIVGGIVAVLVLIVLGRSFLVARAPETRVEDANGTPVITASSAPVRVAPVAPGGLQVPGADQDVLGGSSGDGAANGQLAPAAEAPAPDKLAAQRPGAMLPTPSRRVAAMPPSARTLPREAAATPKPSRASTAVARAPARGAQQVQLGALASAAAARAEWHRLQALLPGVMGGHSLRITTVVLHGHRLYRLRTDGFADRAEARRFCAAVRGHGGDCGVF